LISVRTSGVVQPAASTLATARRAGAVIIHINKDPVNLAAENDISLIGDATALLPTLVAGE
jgi:NAD-dependent deacetylase